MAICHKPTILRNHQTIPLSFPAQSLCVQALSRERLCLPGSSWKCQRCPSHFNMESQHGSIYANDLWRHNFFVEPMAPAGANLECDLTCWICPLWGSLTKSRPAWNDRFVDGKWGPVPRPTCPGKGQAVVVRVRALSKCWDVHPPMFRMVSLLGGLISG